MAQEFYIQRVGAQYGQASYRPCCYDEQYMFGTTVTSDWKEGKESHTRTGQPDIPDNYHTVTVELAEQPGGTRVSLSQDNNPTDQSREHSEKNWSGMLTGLKKLLET